MKIVIVGAGINGCATYLHLRKHLPQPPSPADSHTYTIYEAYDTARTTTFRERAVSAIGEEGSTRSATLAVGGGLGLAPNGFGVLRRLDASIAQDVVSGGHPYSTFNFRSSYGWSLMRMGQSAKVHGEQVNSVAMSRHSIWQCLRDRIPDDVFVTKKIERVIPRGGPSGKHMITFKDGSEPVEADLVIGADGVKSTVKRAVFDAETPEDDPYPPQYEGFVGVGGFLTVTDNIRRHIPKDAMTLTFGGAGMFGYCYSSSAPTDKNRDSPLHISEPGDTIIWWSTYGIPDCPEPKDMDGIEIMKALHKRHGKWSDPVIRHIVNTAKVETMWPTWTTPELPIWDRDGIVLLGDAAHALPPTSGQGSGQALEDSECFPLFLSHYLRKAYEQGEDSKSATALNERDAINLAAKKHRELRAPRVNALLKDAQRKQQAKHKKNVVEEFFMYFILLLVGFFASSNPSKDVFEYNMAEEVHKVLAEENNSKAKA
ncbi:hypothetical protein N7528_002718 [Penicillium herquei]|nr:hypothetical protein N7528_002718 [Penicillium herquei]